MNYIKNNKYILSLVLGIVAVALIIPSITGAIDAIQTIKDYEVETKYLFKLYFTLAQYICIFLAEIIFIIIGVRKTLESHLLIGASILYYASISTAFIYNIFVYKEYSNIFSLIIEILCLVTTILAITKPRYLFSAIVLIIVDAAFNLSKTFAGSTLAFSELILSVLLIFGLYFSCKKAYEVDYDQYS